MAQRAAISASEEAATAAGCNEPGNEAASNEQPLSPTEAAPETATERAHRQTAAAEAKYPRRAMIPAAKQAEFAAYAELGEVRCTACEGGTTNQGWFKLMLTDEMRAAGTNLRNLMVGWAPGEGTSWRGTDVNGSITAQGEIMMGGFRCKSFRLRIERDTRPAERDTRSAERDTYLC